MRLKIRCDGESEKFCKIFWELNKAKVQKLFKIPCYIEYLDAYMEY